MKNKDFFNRPLSKCEKDERVLIDSELSNQDYVGSFGFEWTKIDGFIGKEAMSHGHIFGRFFLPKDYFLGKTVIDVGCGNGIPLIYAYKRFKFKSYSGFDFEKKYVENSKKNLKSSIKNKCIINISHQNAKNYILHENKPFFIFMFNPFNKLIMKKFLENNIKILIKNKSVIAYCNCIELEEIKNFCNNITLIKKYKLALIRF